MKKRMNVKRSFRRFGKDTSGVAAVEFALFAPFMMAAMLGVAEVGLMAFDKMKLTTGVRSASQYILSGGVDDGIISTLISSGSGLEKDGISVTVTAWCDCAVDEMQAVCTSRCSDDDTTRIYRKIVAVTTSDRLFKSWPLESSAEVRTR